MKKKIGLLVIVLSVLMCFLTICVSAGSDKANSQMPFVDSDQIMPEYPDIQTEDEMMEEFEEVFGEGGKSILYITIAGVVFSILFLPGLVLVIIFAVLNSKTKKKVREYERFFGPIPENPPMYYNPGYNNPYYNTQPVNPMNSPMGTPPPGNSYTPENDKNNWQGGQF